MTRTGFPLAALAALAMSACGGSSSNAQEETSSRASAAAPNGAKNEPAAKPKCPARVDKSLKGPDIVGVRLGMTHDEALNVIQCHAKDASILFEDRWFDPRTLKPHQVKLEKQAIVAQTGEAQACNYRSYEGMQKCGHGQREWTFVAERIKVATPGLPGDQRVTGVWRTQKFREGEMPAVASVLAALNEKYGTPQRRINRQAQRRPLIDLDWIADAAGEPLSEAHPMMVPCAGGVSGGGAIDPRPDGGQAWTDGCGLAVAAYVISPLSNPDVVEELHVGMVHHSDLFAFHDAFQQQLDAIEAKRRGEELEKAKSSDVKL